MRIGLLLMVFVLCAVGNVRAQEGNALLSTPSDFDVVYGDESAPVTIVEYASLSCSHCADFYTEVFVKLKEKYVDTGKVRFVYRHFPLNLPALHAAMLVECAPEGKQQSFLGSLFKTQEDWAYQETVEAILGKLTIIAKIGGMDEEAFDACITNKEQEEGLLNVQLAANKELQVRSTPTLFINGEMFSESKTLESVSEAIEKALSQ